MLLKVRVNTSFFAVKPSFRSFANVLTCVLACCAGLLLSPMALAQIAPSPAEIAKYTGLHAAAQRGDVAQIQRLAPKAEALNATDSYGRTPLHVAAFAKQREAIRALVKAGADLSKLESDRYEDAVTIASVADDEETLRVLATAGCQRQADHQPLGRHGLDSSGAFGARRRGAPADSSRCAARSCEQSALDGCHRSRGFGQRRCETPSQPESTDRRRR